MKNHKQKPFKLTISEDTCCVASKTSYIDEDGLDKNGIYYFGKKPKAPVNWKDYKRNDNKRFKLKERYEEDNENSHYFYVMAWKDGEFSDNPETKQRFDIYDDAVKFFNKAVRDFRPYGYAEMFEYISGKRIFIANSDDGLL